MSSTTEFPNHDPLANEVRRAKREQLFGEYAGCVLCGHRNVDALRFVARSVIELHHVIGRANDAATVVPLCANCHLEQGARDRDAGVPLRPPATLLHLLVAACRGLGSFLVCVGEKMATWADSLIALITRLDAELPSWRTFAEVAR